MNTWSIRKMSGCLFRGVMQKSNICKWPSGGGVVEFEKFMIHRKSVGCFRR